MNNNPLFSLITCTYNSEKYLMECLDSVSDQTFLDYEHIFIDGFSTDNTLALLKRYQAKKKSQVRIYPAKARGIGHAMNEGIKKAKGRYLIHLHSDDSFYDKNALRDVATFWQKHSDLDWIYGQIHVVEADGSSFGFFPTRWILQRAWKYLLKYFNFIPHQAVFIKKDVFTKYGYFKEVYKSMMDQELWLRINYLTNWGYIDRVISNYRIHRDAQSSSRDNSESIRAEHDKIQIQYLDNKLEKLIAYFIRSLESRMNKTIR